VLREGDLAGDPGDPGFREGEEPEIFLKIILQEKIF
jgi:hypothetical protein